MVGVAYHGFTYEALGGGLSLRFPGKPADDVRAALKAHGFRWVPAQGVWYRPRLGAYADFLAWLDKRLGPKRPDGACWACGSADGYFRNRGAAAPVWCDRCTAAKDEQAAAPSWYTLPDGWTWENVVDERKKWEHAPRMLPLSSVMGAVLWGVPIKGEA